MSIATFTNITHYKAFLFDLSVARYYTTCQYYDHNLHAVTYLLVLEAWSLFPGVGSFWMKFVLFFFLVLVLFPEILPNAVRCIML